MVEADARHAPSAPDGLVKHVCFFLHGQEYAADIADIKETMAVRPITRVFLTPPWLAGIINLRGDVVAVLDLAQFLGMRATAITDDTRIIIACGREGDTGGLPAGALVGLLVDRVAELRVLDTARMQPPPATLESGRAAVIGSGGLAGLATVEGGRAVRILDMRGLLASDRLHALRREES